MGLWKGAITFVRQCWFQLPWKQHRWLHRLQSLLPLSNFPRFDGTRGFSPQKIHNRLFLYFCFLGFFCPWGPPSWIQFLSELSNGALPFPAICQRRDTSHRLHLSLPTVRCHKTLKNCGDTKNEADTGGYRFCESFCNLSWKLARVRQTLGRSLLLLLLLLTAAAAAAL